MKVGDLVKVKSHCRNGSESAIVIQTWSHLDEVRIQYLNIDLGNTYARKQNLELISEGG